MGKKPFLSAAKLKDFARATSERLNPTKASCSRDPVRRMDQRLPLSDVVSDCARRWFHDTLKEARAGDASMQVLVGQMYFSGYGVARNTQKGKAWMSKAARYRSSVWKVSNKRPGYNASDSDSDEIKGDAK